MGEEKLILDQPDTVTDEGRVEHVIQSKSKNCKKVKANESQDTPSPPSENRLLTEDPEGGIEVITD